MFLKVIQPEIDKWTWEYRVLMRIQEVFHPREDTDYMYQKKIKVGDSLVFKIDNIHQYEGSKTTSKKLWLTNDRNL